MRASAHSLQAHFNSKIRKSAHLVVPPVLFSPDGTTAVQADSPLEDDEMIGVGGTAAADAVDIPQVVSALAELSTPTPPKRKSSVEKKPAGYGAAELSAPALVATSKAHSALAAISVRKNPYTDIRETQQQGSVLTDAAGPPSPRPSSRSPRVAAATPGAAATSSATRGGGYEGNAPWENVTTFTPCKLTVVKPRMGEVFSGMVHPECHHQRGAKDRNAAGVYMSKDYVFLVGYMTNKCLRHSNTLSVSHGGWAYVRDVAYTLWVNEREYGYIGQITEADILFAMLGLG
jgi:hypothetical protein